VAWTPPFWLRNLDLVREEYARASQREMTPDERFQLAAELMGFALDSLRRQAEEEHCSVSELLFRYEQATAGLRTRAA